MARPKGSGSRSEHKRPRASSPHARMEEIARHAGVAPITVSRVFHHPDKVSAKTRERVRKVAEELGYVPNLVAGGLASTRSRIIGALVPFIRDGVFADIVQGISDIFGPEGYQLLLGNTASSLEMEQTLVISLLGQRPAGLILHGGDHLQGTRNFLKNAKVPIVETGNLVEDPIDMVVGYSNYQAACDVMSHLVERGYHHIAFVSSDPETNDRSRERLRGYNDALAARGLPRGPNRLFTTLHSVDRGEEALDHVLAAAPDTDAIFFSSDAVAVGALLACVRRGIRVPDQLAIVGFDDQPLASRVIPALTTVRAPRYDMGRKAAKMLIERLGGASIEGTVVDVGYEILVRDST